VADDVGFGKTAQMLLAVFEHRGNEQSGHRPDAVLPHTTREFQFLVTQWLKEIPEE